MWNCWLSASVLDSISFWIIEFWMVTSIPSSSETFLDRSRPLAIVPFNPFPDDIFYPWSLTTGSKWPIYIYIEKIQLGQIDPSYISLSFSVQVGFLYFSSWPGSKNIFTTLGSPDDEGEAVEYISAQEELCSETASAGIVFGKDKVTQWSPTPSPEGRTPSKNIVKIPKNRIPLTDDVVSPHDAFLLFVDDKIVCWSWSLIWVMLEKTTLQRLICFC